MSLLPTVISGELHDGNFIHALPFCLQNYNCKKCALHYANMAQKSPGFYTCPFGLTTLVYSYQNRNHIFSGLRERKTYHKKLAAITSSNSKVFNPVLNSEEILSLAENECEYCEEHQRLSQKTEEVNNLLHEARKLNGQIKTECDVIWEDHSNGKEHSCDELLGIIQNIHIYSFIVYNRFQYFDTILNPGLTVGSPYKAVIFKKFDKMRKLLRGYGRKNVWISLETQSVYTYRIFQSFETLLFILLENAIKYSPDNSPVTVNFEEPNTDLLTVSIESTGPYCRADELSNLGSKGFRGEIAQQLDSTGQGIGLHFAKRICEQHRIGIDFSCIRSRKDHGVLYGVFKVQLHFDHMKQPE